MDPGDFAILVAMLVVFIYGLSSESPAGSEPQKPSAVAFNVELLDLQQEALSQDIDDDLDFSLPCPPNWAIQEAMDAFYLPMAPAFPGSGLQLVDCSGALDEVARSARCSQQSASTSPDREVLPSAKLDPHIAAISAVAPVQMQGSPDQQHNDAVAQQHLGACSAGSPRSPRAVEVQRRAASLSVAVDTGDAGPLPSSPRTRMMREPPQRLAILASPSPQDPGSHSPPGRSSSGGSWGCSISDGGSGSEPEASTVCGGPGRVPAAPTPVAVEPRPRAGGRVNPPSPVSVLVRAAEFEGLCRAQGAQPERPPTSQASTPKAVLPAPGQSGWLGSSDGGSVSRAPKTLSRVTGSHGTSGGSPAKSAAAVGHNVRYASSGGNLLRARPPGSAGSRSTFSSAGGGASGGGGSNAPAPSFLALARASQGRALAAASPTASPSSPVTTSVKRLAKPNMPRIAGL